MRNLLILQLLFLFLFSSSIILGQTKDNKLIQFSGVVLEGDSLAAIPFASVTIKNSFRGTISDYYGFFSFVALKGDTISFSCIGFQTAYYIIPDTLSEGRYSIIQVLKRDTVLLDEAVIYPFPTREQFREAFLNLKDGTDDYARALKNLNREQLSIAFQTMKMDGEANYRWQMLQYQTKLYQSGQYPVISLMNPIAWAQFIQAWRTGQLKDPTKKK
jgi:hypothetical protein